MYEEEDEALFESEVLVVRRARSHNAGAATDLLKHFSEHGVDAWTAVQYLATTSHGGVRDYLINRMYELRPEAIDFFLPQLCCLMVTWPPHEREGLERFLLRKCSKSLHCAMKMYWLMLAMTPYCDAQEQRDFSVDFAKRIEIDVINSCMPKFLSVPLRPSMSASAPSTAPVVAAPPRPGRTTTAPGAAAVSPCPNAHAVDALVVRSVRTVNRLRSLQGRIEAQARKLGVSVAHKPILRLPPSKELSVSLPRSHSEDSFMSVDGHATSLSSLDSPPPMLRRTSSGIPPSPSSKSHSANSEPSPSSAVPTFPTNFRDFDIFLAKQQMAEFFTAELHLIAELEEISNDLLQYPRSHRRHRLHKLLTLFNERVCRGLYFPNCPATDPHYVILRILPQEAVALSSRDKVPYLMHVEVLYSGHDCAGDVHKAYHVDRESCRRHLLELMGESEARCKAGAGDDAKEPSAKAHEDQTQSPNFAYPFGELLDERKDRVRKSSPFGRLENWGLKMMIFKSGDDCRQELLAMQIIAYIASVFREAKLPLKLRPFEVLVTSPASGMIEVVPDAKSIDSLKKSVPDFVSLLWFFENHFGPRGSRRFVKAQRNFIESMAAYSLICYLLQIKDRHNGNIMLDNMGHIVHIDYGFMLSNSPGGNINFESAPFKLTQEYVEVMEGEESEAFHYYRLLMIRGFLELRKHCDRVVTLAEIMFAGPRQDCFYGGAQALIELRERFHATDSEQQSVEFVYSLVSQSINNWRSVQYDTYQRITNGIL